VCLVACHQNVTGVPGRLSPKMSPVYLVTVTKNVTCVPGQCLEKVICFYGHYHQKCHLSSWSLTKKCQLCTSSLSKKCHPCAWSLSPKMSPVYLVIFTKNVTCCAWLLSPKMSPVYLVTVTNNAKRSGHGVNHQPPSNAGVRERVELYFYSPCRPSSPVMG